MGISSENACLAKAFQDTKSMLHLKKIIKEKYLIDITMNFFSHSFPRIAVSKNSEPFENFVQFLFTR